MKRNPFDGVALPQFARAYTLPVGLAVVCENGRSARYRVVDFGGAALVSGVQTFVEFENLSEASAFVDRLNSQFKRTRPR